MSDLQTGDLLLFNYEGGGFFSGISLLVVVLLIRTSYPAAGFTRPIDFDLISSESNNPGRETIVPNRVMLMNE